MGAWEKAIEFTLGYEGGWCNTPGDRGGETFRGVSRVNYPNWPGWPLVDAGKSDPSFPANVNRDPALKQMAVDFYRKVFWEPLNGDSLPPQMAIAVFDWGVNSGWGLAARMMQRVLRVNPDGVVGPVTVKAAVEGGSAAVKALLTRRLVFFANIMKNDTTQQKWAWNWFGRVVELSQVVFEGKP